MTKGGAMSTFLGRYTSQAYALMRTEITQGRQVYVIYPLVEESEKIDLKAATAMADCPSTAGTKATPIP